MELWIRSQDKEQLRKIVDIKYQKGILEDKNIEVIIGTTQYDEWEVLGQYKSKERALEVLDEIEKLILTRFIVENSTYEEADIKVKSDILCNMSKLYDMPKE